MLNFTIQHQFFTKSMSYGKKYTKNEKTTSIFIKTDVEKKYFLGFAKTDVV